MIILRGACFGALLALMAACADSLEKDIARLEHGDEGAAKARARLLRSRHIDTPILIRAFQSREYPASTRVELAKILHELYQRDENRRLLAVLVEGLGDSRAEVRATVARSLGQIRDRVAVGPLVNQLAGEGNDAARREILGALTAMATEDGQVPFSSEIHTDLIAEPDKMRFTRTLVQLGQGGLSDSLRAQVVEWLEILAAEKALEGQTWNEKGDRSWAEKLLLEARDMIPDSKNINWQLGRFYWESGQPDKGLETLRRAGLLARADRLRTRPRIDGLLDDPAWLGAVPLEGFHRCLWTARAHALDESSEVDLGHLDNALYLGVRTREPAPENLVAEITERDDFRVTRDDCVEIFLDTKHDFATYYYIAVNSIATVADAHNDGSGRTGDPAWDGPIAAAVAIGDAFWTLEMEIPAHRFERARIEPGDVWGLNIARVHAAHPGPYAQWAPTYGTAHRPDRFGFLVFD